MTLSLIKGFQTSQIDGKLMIFSEATSNPNKDML